MLHCAILRQLVSQRHGDDMLLRKLRSVTGPLVRYIYASVLVSAMSSRNRINYHPKAKNIDTKHCFCTNKGKQKLH